MDKTPTRILLIEGHPKPDWVSDYLDGFDVVQVTAGTALNLLAKPADSPIDLVLLDISSVENGVETILSSLQGSFPEIPIVIVGRDLDEKDSQKLVHLGAQDYLSSAEVDARVLRRSIWHSLERARKTRRLQEREQRCTLAILGANDGLWDWSLTRQEIFFSPRWYEILGLPSEKYGQPPDLWLSRIHPDDKESLEEALKQHFEGNVSPFESEHRLRDADGNFRWVLCRGLAVRDSEGRPYRIAGSFSDIGDRKLFEEQLLHDAFTDSLTGLPNRSLFVDRLGISIRRARRHTDYQYAVLFLDLDRFKNVNDSLGHARGDQLLRQVAERLGPVIRQGDTVARLGGDEFAVLLDDISNSSRASMIANRILGELKRPFKLGHHEVFTTASIGIALSSSGYVEPENVLRDADTAMYRAKTRGKAQYAIFDQEMHARAVAVLKTENDLRRAIQHDELRLHYQPIIDLVSGRIRGFEALLRWDHPELGLMLPAEFIPIAEETDSIVDIGHFVMSEACTQMAEWHQRFADYGPLTISVNLSGKEFIQPDLVEQVSRVLRETGLAARSLHLEVKESALMEHRGPLTQKLRDLAGLEVELDIDDFGTGYSSLNYLHELPATALKIDRSFVHEMLSTRNRPEMVGTIVHLARSLGLEVAAAGLETADELRHLRDMQCEYGQGYYFARPMDQSGAATLLASNPQW